MSFYEIAKADDIPEGTMKAVSIQDKELIVINYEGNYYAINRMCTHMSGDLSKGKLEGKIIICPRHGSRFDVTTGKSISGPRIGFLKLKTKDEPNYQIKIENDVIKIDI
ncbi:MAG: Rieske 2Fe-2S domain-containing protein [Actinomycetota bacterium]|nr:Rieske 2Fe-2S domain-containing protein [Actinomycetota bacterium]